MEFRKRKIRNGSLSSANKSSQEVQEEEDGFVNEPLNLFAADTKRQKTEDGKVEERSGDASVLWEKAKGGAAPVEKSPLMPSGEHHKGSHRRYMEDKRLKLDQQRGSRKCEGKAQLFHGDVIWVNGETSIEPPFWSVDRTISEILSHGGTFRDTLSKDVNIVVCRNLNHEKLHKELTTKRRKTRWFVKPTWISNCVEAGVRLPLEDYILDELQPEGNRLTTTFIRKSKDPVSPVSVKTISQPAQTELTRIGAVEKPKKYSAGVRVVWVNLLPYTIQSLQDEDFSTIILSVKDCVMWVGEKVEGVWPGMSLDRLPLHCREFVRECSEEERNRTKDQFLFCAGKVLGNVCSLGSNELIGTYVSESETIEEDWIHLLLSAEFPSAAQLRVQVIENLELNRTACLQASDYDSPNCLQVERRFKCSFESYISLERTVENMIQTLVEKLALECGSVIRERNWDSGPFWFLIYQYHKGPGEDGKERIRERRAGPVSGHPFLVSSRSIARNLLLGLRFQSMRFICLELQKIKSSSSSSSSTSDTNDGESRQRPPPLSLEGHNQHCADIVVVDDSSEGSKSVRSCLPDRPVSQQATPSGIDMDVWENLPSSIRDELLGEMSNHANFQTPEGKKELQRRDSQSKLDFFKRQKKTVVESHTYIRQMKAARQTLFPKTQEPARSKVIDSAPSPSNDNEDACIPGSKDSLPEIKSAVLTYLSSAEVWEDPDQLIACMSEFLLGLLGDRMLDKVQYVLRILRFEEEQREDVGKELNSRSSHGVWEAVSNFVQSSFRELFGENASLAY